MTRIQAAGGNRVDIRGQLLDRLTHQGIANQVVHVAIGDRDASAVTGPDGSFLARIEAKPGPVEVTIAYEGDRLLDRAQSLEVTTDPAKQHIELVIEKRADVPQGAAFRIAASLDDRPIALPTPIHVEVAQLQSNAWTPLVSEGSAATEDRLLTRRQAGGPGIYRVRARYDGDARTQTASAEAIIEVVTSTTTTMEFTATQLAFEQRLGITGSVVDDDHRPVVGAAMTLATAKHRIAHTTTGNDGHYAFTIKAQTLGTGVSTLQVTADPGRSYVKASGAAAQTVTVAKPHLAPVSYTLSVFAITILAAVAFLLARKNARRRLQRQSMLPDLPNETAAMDDVAGGMTIAKPGISAALRRAADNGFGGSVRDSARARPIPAAAIRVDNGVAQREANASVDGDFMIDDLDPGVWRVEVSALGHVAERFAITVPHRGELRNVRIALVPVREKAFQLYRQVAEPALPNSRLWGIWSPRQIVDFVRARRPGEALAELTDRVEEIYFSSRIAPETILAEVRAGVDKANRERTGGFDKAGAG